MERNCSERIEVLEEQRLLADRPEFLLDTAAAEAWEAANARPARDLPGLRAFMRRPTPFVDE